MRARKERASTLNRRFRKGVITLCIQAVILQPFIFGSAHALACDAPVDGQEGADPASSASWATFNPPEDQSNQDLTDETGATDDGGGDGGDQGDGGGYGASVSGSDSDGTDGGFDDGEPPSFGYLVAEGGLSGERGAPSSGNGGRNQLLPPLQHVHDPIDVAYADKRHTQVDYRSLGAGSLRVARVYHSNTSVNNSRVSVPIGAGWHFYYDRSIQQLPGNTVRLHRANGRVIDFSYSGSAWTSSLPGGSLTNSGTGWQYVNHRDQVENYDLSGRLISLSDRGQVVTLSYNASNQLVAASNSFGRSLGFGYDSQGRLAQINLPSGSYIAYSYDGYGNLQNTRFGDGTIRTYNYENSTFRNALTGITDEAGKRRISWNYDSSGRPNGAWYGTGTNGINISYSGNLVTTTDAKGTTRTRGYATVNGRSVLTSLSVAATPDSPQFNWSLQYDALGGLSTVNMRTGETRQFVNDGRGRVVSSTNAAGTSSALSSSTTWHPVFRKPTQTVSAGVTTAFAIDSAGRVTTITKTAGGVTSSYYSASYTAQGLLQSSTDVRGGTTTFTYDSSGNRTSATAPDGSVVRYSGFNADGQPSTVTYPDGTSSVRTFDGRGRTITNTYRGRTSTYAYDAAGRVIKVTGADGGFISTAYDAAGLISSYQNNRGESIFVQRDGASKISGLTLVDAAGNVVASRSRTLDAVNRLSKVTDARGYSVSVLYSADGLSSGMTDANGRSKTITRDALSRVATITQPNTTAVRQATGAATATSTLGYDGRGNRTTVLDVNGITSAFPRDPLNRVNGESGADPGTSSFVRAAGGEATSRTDPRGATVGQSFDLFGRITQVAPPTGQAVSYAYVPGSRAYQLASMTDPSGSTQWSYDSNGRLVGKTQIANSVSKSLVIGRDSVGRMTSLKYPSGLVVGYQYTGDQLTGITANNSTFISNIKYKPFTTTATSWTWSNGAAFSRTLDGDGRVSSVTLGSSTRQYSYDPVGLMTSQVDSGSHTGQTNYSHDEAGQLTAYSGGVTGSGAYSYDTNGNRLSEIINGTARTYAYFPNTNRIKSVTNEWTYSYNADGNPTTDGAFFNYTYDSYGRTISATSPQANSLSYAYNGLSQRVSKVSRPWVCSGGGGQNASRVAAAQPAAQTCNYKTTSISQFLYDDASHLLGDYEAVSGRTTEVIWLNNHPVGVYQGGALYFVSVDNLGTPRAVVRASDSREVWRWDSDPFGWIQPVVPQGVLFSFPLRFAGQYYDDETATSYNGFRDYRPQTGRYLQVDPAGLKGGSSRYSYVMNSPLTSIDPLGLASIVGAWNWSLASGPLGFEGARGMYLNTDGGYGTFGYQGYGPGLNVGTGVMLGVVPGTSADMNGSTYNLNVGYGLASFTVSFAPDGGWAGFYWTPGLATTTALGSATTGTTEATQNSFFNSNFWMGLVDFVNIGQNVCR